MEAAQEQDVLTFVEGRAGRLRLNRPRAIHALTLDMVRAMTEALIEWKNYPEVEIVLVDHTEGRGFCAGGDVVDIARDAKAGGSAGDAFFYEEYQMNHMMYVYPKPGVVFMDGITMGGGVGITGPWKYRVATERTVYSMPETGIGLYPDVGGGRYLSQLPGRLPQFLGLTGARLKGPDCLALQLATHYLPSESLNEVKARIIAAPDRVDEILGDASVRPPPATILEQRDQIDRLFAADRLEDIMAALAADPSEFAQKQLGLLKTKSPLSCKVTLRLLRTSPGVDSFADEMRMEFDVVRRIFRTYDFYEGVRALLIDRDNQPAWNPPTAEAVTDAMIEGMFEPLPADRAWKPHESDITPQA